MGIFFVRKKDKSARLIFDTRLANCAFREPPRTSLPTAAAFARIETPEHAGLRLSQIDLKNAFYHMRLAPGMEQFFVLPRVQTKYIAHFLPEGLSANST